MNKVLILILLALSLIVSACGQATPEPVVEVATQAPMPTQQEASIPTQQEVIQPTEAPTDASTNTPVPTPIPPTPTTEPTEEPTATAAYIPDANLPSLGDTLWSPASISAAENIGKSRSNYCYPDFYLPSMMMDPSPSLPP